MRIAPSILAADFTRLGEEVDRISPTADWAHVDVMDNHFVPNLTLGLQMVTALRARTELPLDCHLMIEAPDRWAVGYAEAGAAGVTVHAEAVAAPVRLARELRAAGARPGIAVVPSTSVDSLADVIGEFDMVLVMTVEPGFGGQSFLDLALPKIRRARELVLDQDRAIAVQVDGGVDEDTIGRCAQAGADVFVAGTSVYGAADPAAAVERLRAHAVAAAADSWWGASR